MTKKYNFNSYINKKIGMLYINGIVEENTNKYFNCKCECGNEKKY